MAILKGYSNDNESIEELLPLGSGYHHRDHEPHGLFGRGRPDATL